MLCRIGLDDTDHIEFGVTTATFDHLLREICQSMHCNVIEKVTKDVFAPKQNDFDELALFKYPKFLSSYLSLYISPHLTH